MRHRVSGKQLSRTTSHRKTLRRNMAASLFQHGAIRTTEAKAKELRRFAERLITIARKGTLHARRQVISLLQDRAMADADGEIEDQSVVQKLFNEIAPRYADRPGGYTRLIRLGERRIGDAGTQVILQLVEESVGSGGSDSSGKSRRKTRAEKRRQAVADKVDKPAEDKDLPEDKDVDDQAEDDADPADEQDGEDDADGSNPRDAVSDDSASIDDAQE